VDFFLISASPRATHTAYNQSFTETNRSVLRRLVSVSYCVLSGCIALGLQGGGEWVQADGTLAGAETARKNGAEKFADEVK
jgi:hypothetical protein